MKKPLNIKKFLLPNIPYVFIALFATKLGQAARLSPGADFSGKALHLMEGFAAAFRSALPSFHPIDLCVGVAAALLIRLIVYVKGKNAKKFRKNLEYGSARWGRPEDIAPYVDPKFENNVILTQTERLMMSNRPKDPKTARNKNVLVVGGSGSGKTRFFIKPNLMQLHSSYVVTDPKGSIAVECGKLMLRNGYKVKIFNSINFKKSHHYNPFAYIHSEKDILKLVTTLIANTKGDGKSGDDFWQKAETLLYTALIGYIHYEAPEEEQNFATLIEFINAMEVREDDETFQNLSVKRLFGWVAMGLVLSMSGITIALFLVTKQIAVLLTGGALLLCALVGIFVLTQAFGKRLSQFTADLCQTLDHMIAGNEAPQRPEDSETQLARIGHRLARLYQIMQENRRRVDEERQELQTLVSDISHQVKTPVSNLKMATDTLLEKPMTEAERTDFIRGIRSQTDKSISDYITYVILMLPLV